MNTAIGILTGNNELIDDIRAGYPDAGIITFKTVASVSRENCSCIIIDSEIFDAPDEIQFSLSRIRKKIQELPVLLIIRVNMLEMIDADWFFDDFILYPFRKGELATRVKCLLWNREEDEDVLAIGHLRVNLNEYTVHLNNQKIELTYKEFELLRLLLQNRGVVFSRKDLLNRIWGIEYIGGTRTVDVHIRRLRGKLGDEFNSIIETVRNVGYRCIEQSKIT